MAKKGEHLSEGTKRKLKEALFGKSRLGFKYTTTKEYKRLYGRYWKERNRDKIKVYWEKSKETRLRNKARIRHVIYSHYGRICTCCGEDNLKFLTIDHINNDGYKERTIKSGKRLGGENIFYKIIREGLPADRYRIMCYNCNCGRAYNNGVCPHKDR